MSKFVSYCVSIALVLGACYVFNKIDLSEVVNMLKGEDAFAQEIKDYVAARRKMLPERLDPWRVTVDSYLDGKKIVSVVEIDLDNPLMRSMYPTREALIASLRSSRQDSVKVFCSSTLWTKILVQHDYMVLYRMMTPIGDHLLDVRITAADCRALS